MKRFEELITRRGREAASLLERTCVSEARTIQLLAEAFVKSVRSGGKILVLGNGGSAADAQHFAAEMVNRFLMERRPLPAIALTTDTSILTSISNDYSFDLVFSRQVEALGREGDVLLAISTSGSSPNVLKAIERANALSMTTAGMTGADCGKMAPLCDLCLSVPDTSTPRIQEVHHLILHLICEIVEIQIFSHGT
ncbi:MAG: D-sedoheptulose 7-phosphate isomerase [bacterium]|nr:MAG: D-sedoheptulose 7-phosphate isomerase [bacterium]